MFRKFKFCFIKIYFPRHDASLEMGRGPAPGIKHNLAGKTPVNTDPSGAPWQMQKS